MSIGGDLYNINIYKSPGSSSGTVETLVGAENPLTTQEDADNNVFKPVRIQTGYIRVVTTDNTLVQRLAPSSPFDRLVRVCKIVSENEVCVWQGYMKQQVFTQPINNYRWQIEFPIVSLLGALQYAYPDYKGHTWVSITNILNGALNSVTRDVDKWPTTPYAIVEHSLFRNVMVYNSTQVLNMPVEEIPTNYFRRNCAWSQLAVRFDDLFFSLKEKIDGDSVYKYNDSPSYYDIVCEILKPFGMVMREIGNVIDVSCAHWDDFSGAINLSSVGLQYKNERIDVSYVLPADSCSVQLNITEKDKYLLLTSISHALLNNNPMFRGIIYGSGDLITQFHDPGVSEHPDENFYFWHQPTQTIPLDLSQYVSSDFDSFLKNIVTTGEEGVYGAIGACHVMVRDTDVQDDKMYPALFIRAPWTIANPHLLYSKKTTIEIKENAYNCYGKLDVETFENYVDMLWIQIVNNGQYFNGTNWVDNEAFVNLHFTNKKVVPNATSVSSEGYIVALQGRRGIFEIKLFAAAPEGVSTITVWPMYITKMEFSLYDRNLETQDSIVVGESRTENVYYSGDRSKKNVAEITTKLGTCVGNKPSPSFFYVPRLWYVEENQYSSCDMLMCAYFGTVGTSNYEEFTTEKLLLAMLVKQNQNKRETRTLTAAPFVDTTKIYKIGTKYYIAVVQQQDWADDKQKVKFLEVDHI